MAAKVFRTDDSKVTGLCKIYAADVLVAARIHPEVPLWNVSMRKRTGLLAVVRDVLSAAIDCCGKAYARTGRLVGG